MWFEFIPNESYHNLVVHFILKNLIIMAVWNIRNCIYKIYIQKTLEKEESFSCIWNWPLRSEIMCTGILLSLAFMKERSKSNLSNKAFYTLKCLIQRGFSSFDMDNIYRYMQGYNFLKLDNLVSWNHIMTNLEILFFSKSEMTSFKSRENKKQTKKTRAKDNQLVVPEPLASFSIICIS